MIQSHILGFPRIGVQREMKKAVEAYWRKEISLTALEKVGHTIESANWKIQAEAGLDFVTVGDFAWYDHVLDMSVLLGVIPERFSRSADLNTMFCMARGQAPGVAETTACEMTKWFNTNYHYIVPEFQTNQSFNLSSEKLLRSIQQAQSEGHRVKPVLLGPLSYLWLGKAKEESLNKLALLDQLLPVYNQLLSQLSQHNIEWVQFDEPILTLDLPVEWQQAFVAVYQKLAFKNILVATYFGSIQDHLAVVKQLPVQGLHIDLTSAPQQLSDILAIWPKEKVLSLGVINGRNIWKADSNQVFETLQKVQEARGENVWVSSSCSLLHSPVDLDAEVQLETEIKNWLSFAKQKTQEVALLAKGLQQGSAAIADALSQNSAAIQSRKNSPRIHNSQVQQRIRNLVTGEYGKRKAPYAERAKAQRAVLQLPLLPTTTIGSFPQTQEIRKIRQDFKTNKINSETYQTLIQQEIQSVVAEQEKLGLDVLVHGEPERNDMVEYFGELLEGFVFTQNGWVQSYGSRCVKPPVIFGDVSRPRAMTVEWSQYAQSLTTRLMKGMLTGPTTILSWSFVRDDQPLAETALQIALALRDEVQDLEKAGIKVIQIDEPAFREALPLQRKDWQEYLDWSVLAFRVASSGVENQTQIHTHMCYSEFNDVIDAIAKLDADVITIESSRSQMELLKAFETFDYPNEMGPGVYDIHSPRVPSKAEIAEHIEKALNHIPLQRLWVNPDCGLKTRHWPEVIQALTHMVEAAKLVRTQHAAQTESALIG